MWKTIRNPKVFHQICEMQKLQTKCEFYERSFKNQWSNRYLTDVLPITSVNSNKWFTSML